MGSILFFAQRVYTSCIPRYLTGLSSRFLRLINHVQSPVAWRDVQISNPFTPTPFTPATDQCGQISTERAFKGESKPFILAALVGLIRSRCFRCAFRAKTGSDDNHGMSLILAFVLCCNLQWHVPDMSLILAFVTSSLNMSTCSGPIENSPGKPPSIVWGYTLLGFEGLCIGYIDWVTDSISEWLEAGSEPGWIESRF